MGNGTFNPSDFLFRGTDSRGATDAFDQDTYQAAVDIESAETFLAARDRQRQITDRGHHDYGLKLKALAISRSSHTSQALTANLRRFMAQHGRLSERDAEIVVSTAVQDYAKRARITDSDFVSYTTASLMAVFKQQRLSKRQTRVSQLAESLSKDKGFQAELAWRRRVDRMAAETGLHPDFVEAFLSAYEQALRPAHAGIISPHGVPFIQLTAPVTAAVDMISDYVPGVGDAKAIIEAATGKGLISGRQLAMWERLLTGILYLLPLLPGRLLSKLRGKAFRVGRAGMRRAVGVGGRVAAKILVEIKKRARTLAAISHRLNVSPKSMLRFISRLSDLPLKSIRRLKKKLALARVRNQAVALTERELYLIRKNEQALAELRSDPGFRRDVERAVSQIDDVFDQIDALGNPSLPTRRLGRGSLRRRVRQVYNAARRRFTQLRDGYARRLGIALGRGGQVHHAIELNVLKRYPGTFTSRELNRFNNMRGIPPERTSAGIMNPRRGRKQLHNAAVRRLWNRHYRKLDELLASRNLRPGQPGYREFVRRYLVDARDEIDAVVGKFFSEVRSGQNWNASAP